MQVRQVRDARLPKLAWVAHLQAPWLEMTVRLGAAVEARPGFLVEGVWNRPFDDGDFDQTECFFGSGVRLRSDAVTFVSSGATTDWLYYNANPEWAMVSNSLPFLLASLDDSLDPRYRGYDRFNDSLIDGIDGHERDLVTLKGGVRRLLFRNLVVRDGVAVEADKPLPPRFQGYEDYRRYLEENYRLIALNARDVGRARPLRILSTQSKGYDTTAVNAIAARYGIDMVFTCTKAKGTGAYADKDEESQRDDDGSQICRVLGLPCTAIDRRRFEKEFRREHLYHACQHANQDANLLDINDHLDGVGVLLTGVLGELWYTEEHYVGREATFITPELRRWDLGGHGLAEVRLEAGFIQAPLPYLGAQRRADIYRITHSAEMAPWRLNTHYDRPIPRRIAEERGVPRDLFGQVKMASVVEFALPRAPHTARLREEYFAFLLEHRVLRRWQLWLLPTVRRLNEWMVTHHTFRYYVERIVSVVLRRGFRWRGIWAWLNGSMFCFGVNKRRREYAQVIAAAAQGAPHHGAAETRGSDTAVGLGASG